MDFPSWDYEQGLTRLEQQLKVESVTGSDTLKKFLVLEHRLKENLINEGRYGYTADLQHQRARIVEVLNDLAIEATGGTTFNDLCRTAKPSFVQKLFGKAPRDKFSRLPRLQNGEWYMNRFVVKGFVGRGGFSDAYIAWDRVRDCEVVIKLFAITEDQPLFFRRYAEREAKMAHKIPKGIPGLIVTHEAIRFQNGICLVQERVAGESLHDRLAARGVISILEALRIGIRICETLGHLHQLGIAHCDVKPLNIIISSPGNPTLIDLGAARFFQEKLRREDVVASIPYSPQELMIGHPVDGRADIYSLGMTLLHTLSGLPACDHPTDLDFDTQPLPVIALSSALTDEEIRQHITTSLWQVTPISLRLAIARALADLPANRYQDVGELRAELIRCLDSVGNLEVRQNRQFLI